MASLGGSGPSLQERYAPRSRCFGCGPANERGLRLGSYLDADGETLVAAWSPGPEHEAFAGFVNGGVLSTLLDCHSNWAAVHHFMTRDGLDSAPGCVTAELAIRFL
ncbi:MAG: PaaI family thioesterase, partial [Chloroflexota bacterium]